MGTKVKSKKAKRPEAPEMDRPATLEEVMDFVQYLQENKHPLDVRAFITVDMVFEGEGTKGWVHTHGMYKLFGLPELEIRDVNPIMLMPAAGEILNHLAQYMVDGQCGRDKARPLKLGETFGPIAHTVILTTSLSTPIHPDDEEENEGHFSHPRWLVTQANQPRCAKCARGDKEHVH